MPLYKQIEMQYEAHQELEERNRQQKLIEHRSQFQAVSFKNVLARQQDGDYDEKLRQRQRMARGAVLPKSGIEGLQDIEEVLTQKDFTS